ncbi:RipA family octameric membrane protein [Enterovibrio norvegicus]|uniref:RipA family octameric membrane protein n=1 Tax=Enterovibrio norvegicus TaxID=188144 RepID=UPI003D16198D
MCYRLFLSLNTALLALTGIAKSTTNLTLFYFLLTCSAGVMLCYVWYRLVLSYKNLNSAKFKVVHEIEKKLPLKLFDAEWDAVGRGNNKQLYNPFTNLEMRVPCLFIS